MKNRGYHNRGYHNRGYRFQVSANSVGNVFFVLDTHKPGEHDQYEIAATEVTRAKARAKARELNQAARIKDEKDQDSFSV